jgi:hypothetical protein
MERWAAVLALSAERAQILKRLMKYGKDFTREVQVIHFRSSVAILRTDWKETS